MTQRRRAAATEFAWRYQVNQTVRGCKQQAFGTSEPGRAREEDSDEETSEISDIEDMCLQFCVCGRSS